MRWERVQLPTQQEQVVQGLPFNEVISTSGPGKRWGHTCNAVKGGRLLYVFGGYSREKSQKITNQVHVFDTVNQTWSQPVIKGIPPTPRDSHTCTTVGDNLFVFGGTDGMNPLNDLHILDTSSHTWISPSVTGQGPGARESHGAVLVGKRLFIFGGCGESSCTNDLYILDTETFVWECAVTSGNPPSARENHTCSSWKNKIIVIGGEDEHDYVLSDVHILDTDTLVWKQLDAGGMLPPRAGHATVALGKFLFVFGGSTDSENLCDDLYMIDVESDSSSWARILTTGERPSARVSLAGDSLDPLKGGVLVFFGGCNKSLEALDDMYYLYTVSMDLDARDGSSDDDELSEDVRSSQNDRCGKKRKRNSSKCWPYFEKVVENGQKEAKCKSGESIENCLKEYGTTNLKKHALSCPKIDTQEIRQVILSENSGEALSSTYEHEPTFESSPFRELISTAIVMHNLPFQFVEYDGVRSVFDCLCHGVPTISSDTAKADVLKFYGRERDRVRKILDEAPGRISLTSNLCTSLTTDEYLCVTAHWIDKDWVLQKRVLSFCLLAPPHGENCLAEKLHSVFLEWGIDLRIFSLTLDNATSHEMSDGLLKSQLNSKNALLSSGDLFHLSCCADNINLIVQECLKGIDDAIQKIRESVKYVKGSQVSKEKFLECVNRMSLDGSRGLRQDIPTRWNSTFLMLESALYYCRAFCNLEEEDSDYNHCLSTDEWESVEKTNQFLGCFYKIAGLFSGSKYPTANLYFLEFLTTLLKLNQSMKNSDAYISNMSTQIWSKFSKYWSDISTTLSIAAVLDPRYKLRFVEFAYTKVYGNHSLEFRRFKESLYSLFDEYKSQVPASSVTLGHANSMISETEMELMKEFEIFARNASAAVAPKNQLELYLEEPTIEMAKELDVLDFWKGYRFNYPGVASMARDILSIPISTQASESAFNIQGRVVDQFQNTFKPDILQALVCTRDWISGDFGQNTMISLDELAVDLTSKVMVTSSPA